MSGRPDVGWRGGQLGYPQGLTTISAVSRHWYDFLSDYERRLDGWISMARLQLAFVFFYHPLESPKAIWQATEPKVCMAQGCLIQGFQPAELEVQRSSYERAFLYEVARMKIHFSLPRMVR